MELINLYPLRLRSVLKDIIWGGHRLYTEYGKGADNQSFPHKDKIAESWELSVRGKENSVIENGECKGRTLKDIIIESGGIIVSDKYDGDIFPLLIKFIDAAGNLSVQVHPDDEFAANNGEANGKTEMWYIADACETSKIVYGFSREITDGEIRKAINEGTFEEYLNYIPVKKGECYFIPAGLVHAIGEGILIAEIQQNSDTTYRFYDYNRTDDKGNKRELHIDKAISACMKTKTDYISSPRIIEQNDAYTLYSLAECQYFKAEKYILHADETLHINCDVSSFQSLLFTDGNGYIEHKNEKYPFKKGSSYFIPAGLGDYTISAGIEAEIIISKI